jgi:hypothetical protein
MRRLDLEALDLVLESADLAHQVLRHGLVHVHIFNASVKEKSYRGFVGGDGASDDGASDTAGAAKCHLRGNVDVGYVLVLTEQRQMEEDSERGGVGGKDDQLGDTAVELEIALACDLWKAGGKVVDIQSWWPRWLPSSVGGSG